MVVFKCPIFIIVYPMTSAKSAGLNPINITFCKVSQKNIKFLFHSSLNKPEIA